MKNMELQYFKLFRDVCKVINSSLVLKVVLMLIKTRNTLTKEKNHGKKNHQL